MSAVTHARPLFGAVEGGGTKFVCAVGYGPDEILARTRIDTRGPNETLAEVADFLAATSWSQPLTAVGVACFGPLELDPQRATYGHTLETPKAGWNDVPIIQPIAERLGVPVALDTDVNAACLAEWLWGAARGCDPCLYLTVGTGIGGGVVVNGQPLRGLMHPEMGHILLPRLTWPDGTPDTYAGACRFHSGCLEGLASGPALLGRLGHNAEYAAPEHPIWELEAGYLAAALATFTLVLSPERIVIGGGIAQQEQLLPRVRRRLTEMLNGYVQRAEATTDVERYVVPPRFGQDAGLAGAFALASQARSE
jgi:fructokinase